jgi:hypothetical protein
MDMWVYVCHRKMCMRIQNSRILETAQVSMAVECVLYNKEIQQEVV